MPSDTEPQSIFPPSRREALRQAIAEAFGTASLESAVRLSGGLSLGGLYQITVGGKDYVVRLDAPKLGFRDPARQYACLKIAAEAGIAPRLHYADAVERIVITDFVQSAPETVPPAHRLPALTEAVKTLHGTKTFPRMMFYLDAVDILIGMFNASGLFPPEALAEHWRLYRALGAAYPRRDPDLVSSHNDLNPANILYSGGRPVFVDWETAFAADRYVDLAAIANFFATSDDEEEAMLRRYFGDGLDDYKRDRFFLLQVNRIFYAVALLNIVAQGGADAKLDPDLLRDTPPFRAVRQEMAMVATVPGQIRFCCIFFNDALRAMQSPRFATALARMRG